VCNSKIVIPARLKLVGIDEDYIMEVLLEISNQRK
jgi:hypothetical protein